MPLCISCNGEYQIPVQMSQAAAQPPPAPKPSDLPWPKSPNEETAEPGPPQAQPLSNLARAYGHTEEVPPFVCARCGESNEQWHRWASASGLAHFSRFFFHSLPWGWLALSSFVLPVLAAWALDFVPVASERVGIPLAILLIFVNFALLYALKYSLWRFDLLARVGRSYRPTMAFLGIATFVVALIFGLVIVFMLEIRNTIPEIGPTEGLTRVTTTILLAMTFVNVTLSAMFMSAHDFGHWLNREMPQPIFAQERRLLPVIEDGVREKIRHTTSRKGTVETTIVEMERTGDAGVILTISAETEFKPESGGETMRQAQNWRVEADKWGRIMKMSKDGPPQYSIVTRVAANGNDNHGNGQTSEAGPSRPALTGEIIPPERTR